MESIVLTGNSVEKILKDFCKSKKIDATDISYEVLEEGKAGLFGFIGGKKASLKITSFGDKRKVLEFIEQLLEKMGVDYLDIEVTENSDSYTYHIIGSTEAGFLIGKEARFLNNLQYLVNRIFETKERKKRIYLDVDDYKKRQAESIIKKYEPILDKVIANQKPYTLDPLDPNIRRVLHQFIDERDNLSTLTIGDGKRKRIVVFPKGYDQTKIRKRSYVPPRKRPNNPQFDKNEDKNAPRQARAPRPPRDPRPPRSNKPRNPNFTKRNYSNRPKKEENAQSED